VADAPTPTLVVVSGPAGSGKTTLAHALATAIPCPAVSRDEIKEGMVHAHGGDFEPAPGDALTQKTFPLFFDVLRLLLEGGASVVAEAAFQDRLWRTGLEPLAGLALLRIVHCDVDAVLAHERVAGRMDARLGVSRHGAAKTGRSAHADASLPRELEAWTQHFAAFDRVSIDAPSIVVDTTDGYVPALGRLVDFVNA
jgi:predicted kinase